MATRDFSPLISMLIFLQSTVFPFISSRLLRISAVALSPFAWVSLTLSTLGPILEACDSFLIWDSQARTPRSLCIGHPTGT